jgi:hypothetical protein
MQLKLIRKNLGRTFGSSSNANIPEGDVTIGWKTASQTTRPAR